MQSIEHIQMDKKNTETNVANEPKVDQFEHSVRRLESLIQKLEDDKTSLEETIGLYEEGLRLIKSCNELLDHAKLRIETVAAKADN